MFILITYLYKKNNIHISLSRVLRTTFKSRRTLRYFNSRSCNKHYRVVLINLFNAKFII